MVDISTVSTEALQRELRLRQSQAVSNLELPASDPLNAGISDEDVEEESDSNSLFVPEWRGGHTSFGLTKLVEVPATRRSTLNDNNTPETYGPLEQAHKEPMHKPAAYNLTSARASRKRQSGPSCEFSDSEDELNSSRSSYSAITHQASAFSRITCAKRRKTTTQQEKDDRRLAERLAAEEEDDLLMLIEGQWTKARPGTKVRLNSVDQSMSRTKDRRVSADKPSFDVGRHSESSLRDSAWRQSESFSAAIARQLQKEEIEAQEARIREAAPRTRDCAVCGDAELIIDLPSLSSCTHDADVCADCYTAWLGSQLEENGWQEVKCPGRSCKVKLTYDEIKAYASNDIFERYDVIQARNVLSADPNFHWCRAEGCSSGQIHDVEEVGNEFVCFECHESFCTVHEGLHDDDETCEDYEYRTSGQKDRDERKKEDEASEEAVKSLAKKCPQKRCGAPIQKNGGCNHITCWKCRGHFCYVCLGKNWDKCGHLHTPVPA